MKITRTPLWFPALTALLVVLHVAALALYLRGDLDIERKDVAAHLKVCTKYHLQMRDLFRKASSPWGLLRDSVALFHQSSMPEEHIWIWPRLIYAVTLPVTVLFGLTPRVIIASNMIWLAVLLISLYRIGSGYLSAEAGFLSAAAASLFPVTYGMTRGYGLDFPLMAAVALNIYWLMRTESFSRTRPSVVFGCTMGLGLLIKMQILIFLCGPILCALLLGARTACRERRDAEGRRTRARSSPGRFIANVSAVLFLGAGISSLFWWGNLGNLADIFFKHAARVSEFGNVDMDKEHLASFFLSPHYFCYYPVAAIIYVSPVLIALCAAVFPCFLRSAFRGKAFILLWIIAPYVLWTMIQVKYDVYYFGSLPAFAVVIGCGLAAMRGGLLKTAMIAGAAAWGLYQFANISFSIGPPPYAHCRPFAGDCLRSDGYPIWAHPAFPNNLERVARRFIGEIDRREKGNRYVRIGVCEFDYSAEDYLFVDSFEYFMESVNPTVYVYRSHFAPDSFLESTDSFNYLVVLEKGEKAQPDFRRFVAYFSQGRGAWLAERYLGGAGALARLVAGYRGYELVDRAVLSPAGVSAFLMRKPPFPVRHDTIVPATHLVSANVFIAYPRIGVDERLRRPPTIGDYDVLFPYDLEFPLVPPVPRDPSEPYFARYRLSFERAGSYELVATLADEGAVPPRAFVEGAAATGGAGGEGSLGSFSVGSGAHELELRMDGTFPVVERLRIMKRQEAQDGLPRAGLRPGH
jgi:hypothetical protein